MLAAMRRRRAPYGSLPEAVAGGVARLLGRLDGQGRGQSARVWPHWAQVVGPTLAAHVRPLAVRGRTLVVGGQEPVILQEMSYFQLEMLERINGFLGQEVFDKIVFELLSGRVPLDAAVVARRPACREAPRPGSLGGLERLLTEDSAVGRAYRTYVGWHDRRKTVSGGSS